MSDTAPVLGAREAAQLFNERVRPELLGPPTLREQPVYVGIGGQPGIGKTTAQLQIRRQLGLERAYVLDGDEFLPLWPGYAAAQRRNDLTAAYLASEATGVGHWWQRAARILRAQGRDVVSTYPMAFPQWDIPRLQEFRNASRAPYRTIAVYVIGPDALSLQGIALRYHDMHRPEAGSYGRWVLPETHDLLLRGSLNSAEAIYQQRAAHELHGMRRDGTLVYSNEDSGDGWRLQLPPGHVFETERLRPLNAEVSAEFLRGQGNLRVVAAQAREWEPLVDSIDQRAIPVLAPVVLLSDNDLAARIRLLPLIREQAVLDAERHGVTRDLLSEQHARGDIDRRVQQMLNAGVPASEVERWRNQADHDRFAQGLTTTNFATQVAELQTLNDALVQEFRRRRTLSPQARESEDRGRSGPMWPPTQALVPLPPKAEPIILSRKGPMDPGPGVNLQPGATTPAAGPAPAQPVPSQPVRSVGTQASVSSPPSRGRSL